MTDTTPGQPNSSEPNPDALVEGQRVAQASDMESSSDTPETESQTLDAQTDDEKDRAERHY